MAESLFFPNRAFKSLKLEDHVCFICDFSQNEVDKDCTVEDLYDKNKVKILRLYLYTKYIKKMLKMRTNPLILHQQQAQRSEEMLLRSLVKNPKSLP